MDKSDSVFEKVLRTLLSDYTLSAEPTSAFCILFHRVSTELKLKFQPKFQKKIDLFPAFWVEKTPCVLALQ